MIRFIKEIKSVIDNNAPLKEAIIFATDTKEMFVDINNTRLQINDIVTIEKEADLDNILAPLSNKFYFVEENNIFYKFKDGKWVAITSTYAQYEELSQTAQDLLEKYEKITTEVNIDYLLEASKWVGNKYTINDPLFTSESTVKLSAPTVTNTQYTALSSAKIIPDDSDFANNNLILEATGEVPTIDIPIQISVFISSESLQNVQDNLTSTSRVNPLSANQGRVLNAKIGDLSTLNTTDKSDIVSAVNELFQDVDNGKAILASAITDKGVNTPQGATFQEMATNVSHIVSSSAADLVKQVTSKEEDVLEGKFFIDEYGDVLEGTMPNNTPEQKILNPGESTTISLGYHDGTGTVSVPTLESLTSGTAEATEILSGETAYVNGVEVTGTMPNNTPEQKTLQPGETYDIALGYHDGTGTISVPELSTLTQATATSGEILSGKTAYVNGNKVTGTIETFGEKYSYKSTNTEQVIDTTNKYLTSNIVVEPFNIEEAKTVIPTTSDQVISPSTGNDALSTVTVKGDSNLIPENIKTGVTIFGVAGNISDNKFDNVFITNIEPTSEEIVVTPAIWLDTTDGKNLLKIYDGTQWVTARGTWS